MAKFIEWSREFSVGMEEIDEQHKVLVGLINETHEAINQRHDSDVVKDVLGKLADYTKFHFAVEESLMRILGYPDYEAHKEQHAELIGYMLELQQKADSGKTAIGFDLQHFLMVWLTRHIMKSDQQYSQFFVDAGAKTKLKKSWDSHLWGS